MVGRSVSKLAGEPESLLYLIGQEDTFLDVIRVAFSSEYLFCFNYLLKTN